MVEQAFSSVEKEGETASCAMKAKALVEGTCVWVVVVVQVDFAWGWVWVRRGAWVRALV